MKKAVDPAQLVLARRPVAEHRMDVAVDQAGRHGRAFGVDHHVRLLGVDVLGLANRRDAAVDRDDGIGVEDQLLERAREQGADVLDDQLAFRRTRPLPE